MLKNKNSKNTKTISAFSLLEISIVLMLSGAILALITNSVGFFKKSKINYSRSITASSPAASIPGMVFWVESVSKKSFDPVGSEGSFSIDVPNDEVITNWYDINPQQPEKLIFTQTNGDAYKPKYLSNSINGLPAIYFNGLGPNALRSSKSSFIYGSNSRATIFAVIKPTDISGTSSSSDHTILAQNQGACGAGFFNSILLTINRAKTVTGGGLALDGGGGDTCGKYTTTADSYLTKNEPVILTVTILNFGSVGSNILFFKNGTKYSDSFISGPSGGWTGYNANSPPSQSQITIGAYNDLGSDGFTGYIGEIIVYNTNLTDAQRKNVESYLGTKWGIKVK